MNNLIMVEGIEGCGKTTLAKNLQKLYRENNKSLEYVKAPISESLTGYIRGILAKDTLTKDDKTLLALSFILDKLEALSDHGILQNIKDTDIILDRFLISNYVYNYSDLHLSASYHLFDLMQTKLNLLPLRKVYIYVDIPVETTLKRIQDRNEKKEAFDTENYQSEHRQKFLYYESRLKERMDIDCNDNTWMANYPETEIFGQISKNNSIYIHTDGTIPENELAKKIYDLLQI